MRASVVSKDLLRTFVPPTELARSRPRDVHLTAGGRSLVIVAWLCVAGAIAGGVALHREARRQSAEPLRNMIEKWTGESVPGG